MSENPNKWRVVDDRSPEQKAESARKARERKERSDKAVDEYIAEVNRIVPKDSVLAEHAPQDTLATLFEKGVDPEEAYEMLYAVYDNPNKDNIHIQAHTDRYGDGASHLFGLGEAVVTAFEVDLREEGLRYLRDRLLGETIVDLGCGKNVLGERACATYFPIENYVGVDGFKRDTELRKCVREDKRKDSRYRDDDVLATSIREEDFYSLTHSDEMLHAVSRMESGSANFMFSAIDFLEGNGEEYCDYLGEELARVTKLGGVIFGRTSDGVPSIVEKTGCFEKFPFVGGGGFIYTKIREPGEVVQEKEGGGE